jgi:hypothetical protein
VYEYHTGEKYEGPWENGKRVGKAKYYLHNGDLILIEFVADEMNGEGKRITSRP